MPENEIIPDGEVVPETAKEKFERERLSRRQALKKFGITSAMATFALFSVDDLARMVGKAMQQRAGDNRVVEQIAKEFQQAGIVLADASSFPGDCGTTGGDSIPSSQRGTCCSPANVGSYCSKYPDYTDCDKCINNVYGDNGYCKGYNNPSGTQHATASNYCPVVAAV